MDPLSAGPGSVRLLDAGGRPVPVSVAVEGGRVFVRPAVGPAELARPPARWTLEVAGGPSPLALRTLDGRRLGRGVAVGVEVEPRLDAGEEGPPRLVAVQGGPPGPEAALAPDGSVVLEFEGVLDPGRLRPADCALRPLEGGLELAPVEPEVDWTCRAQRCELRLRVPRGGGPLLLGLRRSGLRGLDGRGVEPALEIVLR